MSSKPIGDASSAHGITAALQKRIHDLASDCDSYRKTLSVIDEAANEEAEKFVGLLRAAEPFERAATVFNLSDITEGDLYRLICACRAARLASGMSASGQDPKGLEAKPASPARKAGDAQ